MQYNIVIFGLGYIGLPLINAIESNLDKFKQESVSDKIFNKTLTINKIIGYDINEKVVEGLKEFNSSIIFESCFEKVKEQISNQSNIYIVCVPTNVDKNNMPDYSNVENVIKTISTVYDKNKEDIIISESTVGVGDTRRIISKIIPDAYFGYCPERLCPNTMHLISNINKVVSCNDTDKLNIITELYSNIISDDNYVVQASVEEAEACKLLENIQRDVNIALLNEYKHYCDKNNISILDIVNLCSTKYSWVPFVNGLVGGCCIPVDPYYAINNVNTVQLGLISKAREVNENFVNECYNLIEKHIIKEKPKTMLILGSSYKVGTFSKQNSKALGIIRKIQQNFDIEIDILSDTSIEFKNNYDLAVVLVPDKKFVDLDIMSVLNKTTTLIDLFGLYKEIYSHDNYITI